MSTVTGPPASQRKIDRCHRLQHFLDGVGDLRPLLQPEQLAARLNALDQLDAILGDQYSEASKTCSDPAILAHANALRSQLEAANETLYRAARSEIALHGTSPAMHRWLRKLAKDAGRPRPGLSFDLLDEVVSDILRFRGPEKAGPLQSSEMVPYQPTPVRHILHLIAACRFSSDDILVDLGSGLGHVPLLVSILTGIRTLGVELQQDYVASAQEAARNLNLRLVRFAAEDARTTDLSSGTVFYMFTPFTGSILADVLDRLRQQSKKRPIRICTLGPCTRTLQNCPWLAAGKQTHAERIAVFHSR